MGVLLAVVAVGALFYMSHNRKTPKERIAEAETKVQTTASIPESVQQQIDDVKTGMENLTFDVLQKVMSGEITEAEGRQEIAKLEQLEAELIEGYANGVQG